MKRRRNNCTGVAGFDARTASFRGQILEGLGWKKRSRDGVVLAAGGTVVRRSRPHRNWTSLAATTIFATCSIVAAFVPHMPVVTLECPTSNRHRYARIRPRNEPFGVGWDGRHRSSSAATSQGEGGRHAHELMNNRGRHGGGSSKFRLSSASVMEQPSTRDTSTETPGTVGAPPTSRTDDLKTPTRGRKKKTLEASGSRITGTRASKGGETKADSGSRYSTVSAPSRAAAAESRKRDPPNLQRYYKTELLTAEEEYTLGMRVRLMVQCEAVHEGLSLALERAPSLKEWAAACGYNEENSEEGASHRIDEREEHSIRPAGSTSMRQDRDPNMFVGNGLAGGAGVGRGNGRAKKAPPVKLGEFWDDSVAKFKKRRKSKKAAGVAAGDGVTGTDATSPTYDAVLVNKGTVREFVDMMILGREAKQRMIQCNMRLAVSIAKRYRNVGVNIADLVQEGSIGLARAAEKFDPKRGFKFSTYASWYVARLYVGRLGRPCR